MIRPDLDGLLLRGTDDSRAFLVFEGRRHPVSSDMLDALFEAPQIKAMDLTVVDEGLALQDGTCLARAGQDGPIYLLAVSGDGVRRHLIKDYESFKEFGFSLDRVVRMPGPVLKLVPEGCELTGALSRVGRW